DPELLPARGIPVGLGNLLNRVGVKPGFAPRDVLCHFPLLSLMVPGTWRGHEARDQRLPPGRGRRAASAGRARRARPPGRSHAERPSPLFRPAWPCLAVKMTVKVKSGVLLHKWPQVTSRSAGFCHNVTGSGRTARCGGTTDAECGSTLAVT